MAVLGDFTQQGLTAKYPVMIWPAQKGSMVCLANQDLTNNAYIGRKPNFAPNGSDSLTIPPLGSITIDGSKVVYALGAANNMVPLLVMPGGGQWAPSPAQVAAQINALGLMKDTTGQNINGNVTGVMKDVTGGTIVTTLGAPAQDTIRTAIPNNISTTGAPLLNFNQQVLNAAVQTITAGNSFVYPVITFNQPGLEIILQLESPSATTQTKISVTWLDQFADPISVDTYWVYPGTTGNPHILYARGPVDGVQCTITIASFTGTTKVDQLLVYSTSKLFQQWQFESTSMPALANTFGLSLIEPAANIIGRRAPAVIAAGATDTTCLGMYVGKVWVFANTTSLVNDMTLKIQYAADQTGQDNFTTVKSDGAGDVNFYLQFPRAQSLLSMINGNAASQTLRYVIVTAEY